MTPKLTDDLLKEVDAHAGQPVKVEHPSTHKVYVIIDHDTHERAMRALQQQEDWESVQRGLEDREQGNELPLPAADAKMRNELGYPPPA